MGSEHQDADRARKDLGATRASPAPAVGPRRPLGVEVQLGARPSLLPAQRAASAIALQRGLGNQATARLLTGPSPAARSAVRAAVAGGVRLQAKLTVGEPDDPLEHEADRVASRVMAMPDPGGEGIGAPGASRVVSAEAAPLARKAALPGGPAPDAPPAVAEALREGGAPLDAGTGAWFGRRFGASFDGVRVHTGERAARSARSVNALAYTVGQHVVFGEGQYAPGSPEGRRLLAHELTHVVQQGAAGGDGAGLIQRRVPDAPGTDASTPPAADPVGLIAARTGLARDLSRTWGQLTAAQQTAVRTAAGGFGITWVKEDDLLTRLDSATRAQLLSFAQAIRTAAPDAALGDPLLIDVGARPGTADAANITTLVTNANAVFATIAGGTKDADVGQVFGVANVAAAKVKYAAAAAQMNALKATNKIVTDRSGYNAQVGLGGLSNSAQISVSPETIDKPGDKESIVTLIHESMHAGNNDVSDFGYIGQPSFTALAESVKLTNAAHFEVVPRRILGASNDFAGQTFIPAGAVIGGVAAPALTTREQAIRDASETYRSAWTAGLNLHTFFVRLFRTPTEWSTLDLHANFGGAAAGAHFSDTMPFWSKVEMLTMHTRLATIDPAGAPAVHPVTLIDVSLSEGVTRKLSEGMNTVPQTPADALALETSKASAAERTAAAASANAERDLLIRLVLRVNLGSITGAVSRDERVVARLAQAGRVNDFSEFFQVRAPSSFP